MYIAQAYKAKADWWRYFFGIIIIFLGWQLLGVIPLTVVAFFKAGNVGAFMAAAGNNFSTLGIDPNLFLFLYIVMFSCGLLGVWFSVKFLHQQSFRDLTTTRKRVDWGRIKFSFWMVVLVNLILFGIGYLLEPEMLVWNFNPIPFFILCFLAIFLLPLQTSFEEYLFRGYLMQGIGIAKRRNLIKPFIIFTLIAAIFTFLPLLISVTGLSSSDVFTTLTEELSNMFRYVFYASLVVLLTVLFVSSGKARALILTSVFFGLLHSLNPEVEKMGYIMMVFYIGTGFLLGIMTLMDEGMELALGFHAGNNIFAAIMVTTDWTAFQVPALFKDISEPTAGIDIVAPVVILYPLYLFILARKYNWTNWKEKLFGKVNNPELTANSDQF